jgi:hypothetical protein
MIDTFISFIHIFFINGNEQVCLSIHSFTYLSVNSYVSVTIYIYLKGVKPRKRKTFALPGIIKKEKDAESV